MRLPEMAEPDVLERYEVRRVYKHWRTGCELHMLGDQKPGPLDVYLECRLYARTFDNNDETVWEHLMSDTALRKCTDMYWRLVALNGMVPLHINLGTQ